VNKSALTAVTGLGSLLLLLASAPAAAYLSPGSGLGALSVLLGSIGVVFLVVVGFFWYPIKRAMARLRGETTGAGDEEVDAETAELPDSPENPTA